MGAKKSNRFVLRGEIDERVRNFGRITLSLVGRRDTVSNFGDAVRIGRTGKTAQADQNVIDLVDNTETESPRICFPGILDTCLKVG